MHRFFLSSLFAAAVLLGGCSRENGFTKFHMSKEEALSANSVQNKKIFSGGAIAGIFSSIYLNDVYPQQYKDGEYFYVYLYVKAKENQEHELSKYLTLNGISPLEVTQLPHANQFSHLVSAQNEWNSYYLVKFSKQGGTLSLQYKKSEGYYANPTIYKKDDE